MGRAFVNGIEQEPAGQSIGPRTANEWQLEADRLRASNEALWETINRLRAILVRVQDEALDPDDGELSPVTLERIRAALMEGR